MRKIFIGLLTALLLVNCGSLKTQKNNNKASSTQAATQKKYLARTIAFYNLENLFDTIDDPNKFDEDFTPEGRNNWTSEKYHIKLNNLATVLADIGKKETGFPPVVIGVAEVENKDVLQDLITTGNLKGLGYGIIHFDSPDRRGIDVALLYRQKIFNPINFTTYPLYLRDSDTGKQIYTRDQLVVTGSLDGELISIIVDHWPSRRGGEARSLPKRIKAAKLTKHIKDSILRQDANAKIVIMGDLNDDPNSPSVKKILQSKAKKSEVTQGTVYNTMENFFNRGIGTLAYRDSWNLFDQIMITPGLLHDADDKFHFYKAGIYSKEFMKNKRGRYKGYPKRTFAGGEFLGGYSDHFPTYIIIIKAVE
jgi:exonuclease III